MYLFVICSTQNCQGFGQGLCIKFRHRLEMERGQGQIHLSHGGNKLTACFTPYFASLRGCCVQLLDAIFPKSSEARVDYRASLSPVTHEQIIAIFKAALEQVLEEERADVNTTDSHATNVPVQSPSIMVQKRQFGDVADSEPYIDQHIPIVNTAPIHNVVNFKDLGIRPVPD